MEFSEELIIQGDLKTRYGNDKVEMLRRIKETSYSVFVDNFPMSKTKS